MEYAGDSAHRNRQQYTSTPANRQSITDPKRAQVGAERSNLHQRVLALMSAVAETPAEIPPARPAVAGFGSL